MTPRDLSAGPPLDMPDDDLYTKPGDEPSDIQTEHAARVRAGGYAAMSLPTGKPLAIDAWRGRLPMKPPGVRA